MEIQLDPSTLPNHGQKVTWQTHEDFEPDVWRNGIFIDGEFHYRYKGRHCIDSPWNVCRWLPRNTSKRKTEQFE